MSLRLVFTDRGSDILPKGKAYERKVVVLGKEDFHTKGTFYHITTGTKRLQMSFYTL